MRMRTMFEQDRVPTVPTQHLSSGTTVFQIEHAKPLQSLGMLAIPGRLELPTYGLGNRRSVQLSYGTAQTDE
jgi:hypothetical protein